MRSYSLVILLFLTGALYSAPPALTLPESVKGDVAAFVQVPAKTDGKVVKWIVLDKGLNLFPVDKLKDTKTAIVTAAKAGKYRIMAITCLGDELSEPVITVVVIGNGNGNGPPPPPDPVVSELTKVLRTAYAKDTEATRANTLATLKVLYDSWAITLQDDEKTKNIKTWGDLLAKLKESSALAGIKATDLLSTRTAIGSHLKSKFPTDGSKVLDSDGKKLASAVFKDVGKSLGEVK